jgi:stage II sporulation protein GA (sporulation sigma-E factor processing peptidase)
MINLHAIQVYLDLPLLGGLLGWIQDSTLLWMVSQISGVKIKLIRLVLGGVVGGIFQFLLLINQVSSGLLNSWILTPLIFLIVIPFLMIFITLFPVNLHRILRVGGYFYILAFLLSGIHWGFDSLNSRFFHFTMSLYWRFCLHLTSIFVFGELGWGIVHRKLWEKLCYYPIQIDWEGRQLRINALLDTGNHLHDPMTKLPVIIIELNEIKDYLPKEVISLTESCNMGEIAINEDWELPGKWVQRMRVLPYNSLGSKCGMLLGFRPDRIKVWQKEKEIVIKDVIIALYNQPLSQEGVFHALIPPTILN